MRSAIRIILIVFACLGCSLSPTQAAPDTYQLLIGVGGTARMDLPDNEIRVNVVSADGLITYGSCLLTVFTIPAACGVDVPFNTSIVMFVDETTVPPDVVVTNPVMTFDVPASGPDALDVHTFMFDDRTADMPSPTLEPAPDNMYPMMIIIASRDVPFPESGTVHVVARDADSGEAYDHCWVNLDRIPPACTAWVPFGAHVDATIEYADIPAGAQFEESSVSYTVPLTPPESLGDVDFTLIPAVE